MNKVYDYMMAAKPIVYGVEAANNDVEEASCGITIHPGSAEDVCCAITQLRKMTPAERSEMGQQGKDWVTKNCDYFKLAEQFLNVLKKE